MLNVMVSIFFYFSTVAESDSVVFNSSLHRGGEDEDVVSLLFDAGAWNLGFL